MMRFLLSLLLFVVPTVSQSLSPIVVSTTVIGVGRVLNLHDDGNFSLACIDAEGVLSLSTATVAGPTIVTSWKDAAGNTHTCSTPVPSNPSQRDLERAIDQHASLLAKMQTIWPPCPGT